jgi:hypothetical protein
MLVTEITVRRVDDAVQIREIDFNLISNMDIPINHRDLFLRSERTGSP